MPGVIAVFTGAELAAAGVQASRRPRTSGVPTAAAPSPRAPRAPWRTVARYVGEAIAAVVADSRDQARDALDALVLDPSSCRR